MKRMGLLLVGGLAAALGLAASAAPVAELPAGAQISASLEYVGRVPDSGNIVEGKFDRIGNRQVLVTTGRFGFKTYDVSDPTTPVLLDTFQPPGILGANGFWQDEDMDLDTNRKLIIGSLDPRHDDVDQAACPGIGTLGSKNRNPGCRSGFYVISYADPENLTQIGGRLSTADEGTLRIVTTHTQARYTLPPIIARFKQAFPHVRLALNQASPRDIGAILLEGETDIGLATDTMENTAGLVTFPYFTWEHAVIVPAGHPLERTAPLTLEAVAEWPIITYDEGLTGRTRIDDAFVREGIVPDIAISALDADVIKSYVELGLGVGIIAAMAFDSERDTKLRRLASSRLFDSNTSSLGIRRGRYLRGYVYRFIELCSPALTEAVVRKTL